MSNRPTPETEAAVIASNGQWSFVLRETCERLERERDEAREKIAELLRCHHDEPCTAVVLQQVSEIKQLRRERDEAREQIKGWENKWRCAVEMAALAQLKLDNMKEETK